MRPESTQSDSYGVEEWNHNSLHAISQFNGHWHERYTLTHSHSK
jgi:hypothetical protein